MQDFSLRQEAGSRKRGPSRLRSRLPLLGFRAAPARTVPGETFSRLPRFFFF